MASKSEIQSLVYLLDDPDEFVRSSVLDRFKSLNQNAIPVIDEVRVGTKDPVKRKVLDDTILNLTLPSIQLEYQDILEGGVTSMEDLEKAILLLCRIENPTIREEIYIRKLNFMASEIHAEIIYTLQPVKQMELLLYHVFHTHGFRPPVKPDFTSGQIQLSSVLDGREGIPLSLTLIVLFLARRLELPFSGVNMPIHFLMRYDFDAQVVYLDPYNGGRPVSVEECLSFLKKNNIRPEQTYFNKSTPMEMLNRSLRNLYNAYQAADDHLRRTIVEALLDISSPEINFF